MKITVDESLFVQRFKDYGRQDQFSYDGLAALFYFLNDIDDQCNTNTELDVIALCCDFHEISIDEIETETGCESLDDLRESTIVIEVDDETIIYQSF